ncbi:hypothetical protein GWK47_014114 [Chionoecetes opilio]|uniref:Uncharacterized protein n=1 Tax=Chionoecetes opilio TaxID=41210 RepID=A0A8J4XTJ0_CHIOP|nr:hypothetical protein GWK47_014114 [Chionoecetes opilio]
MITYIIMKTHPVSMSSSKPCKPSRELRRVLKGALAMARDRGYVMRGDNPLLTPPPCDSKTFFRSFPAHFDVTDRLGQQVIRFEFWKKPLSQLPGRGGEVVAQRVRRAARRTGVPLTRLLLVLLVPQYTHQQERRERRAMKGLGAHLEVFTHQFFSRANELPASPPCELLADRMLVERYQDVYGHVGDLPKINADNFWCRYLGAAYGDILLTSGGQGGMRSMQLVVPSRRACDDHSGEAERRVTQWRDARTSLNGYLEAIRENPHYY